MTNYTSVFGIWFFFLCPSVRIVRISYDRLDRNCVPRINSYSVRLAHYFNETKSQRYNKQCMNLCGMYQFWLLLLLLCDHWLPINFIRKSMCTMRVEKQQQPKKKTISSSVVVAATVAIATPRQPMQEHI